MCLPHRRNRGWENCMGADMGVGRVLKDGCEALLSNTDTALSIYLCVWLLPGLGPQSSS